MNNQRYHPRFEAVNLVEFVHFDKDFRKDIEDIGRTLDISEGGILLECTQQLPKNTQVELNLAISEEIITVRGEVVHTAPSPYADKFDIGIKFTLISKPEKEIINKFLANIDNKPGLLSRIL